MNRDQMKMRFEKRLMVSEDLGPWLTKRNLFVKGLGEQEQVLEG